MASNTLTINDIKERCGNLAARRDEAAMALEALTGRPTSPLLDAVTATLGDVSALVAHVESDSPRRAALEAIASVLRAEGYDVRAPVDDPISGADLLAAIDALPPSARLSAEDTQDILDDLTEPTSDTIPAPASAPAPLPEPTMYVEDVGRMVAKVEVDPQRKRAEEQPIQVSAWVPEKRWLERIGDEFKLDPDALANALERFRADMADERPMARWGSVFRMWLENGRQKRR